MTIVVTGGGSGGHITPILAVAHELKRLRPDVRIVYVGVRGDSLNDVVAANPAIDEIRPVSAGKLRRYHGEGLRQLLDAKTIFLNIRDVSRMLAGFFQSFSVLHQVKPAVIFTRGSFVSVPVCLAAAVLRIPYVTHDSDAIPSLTNRLIARWARLHAVALPAELYPYPIDKTITVGVPISPEYQPVTDATQLRFKQELGLSKGSEVLLVTGGGLGAGLVNRAAVANAAVLLRQRPELHIFHLTGRMHEEATQTAYRAVLPDDRINRVHVLGFSNDMPRLSGAADVVLARAGATGLAELAVQGKACIIVPNPLLTGGHQLKNTTALSRAGAVIELSEAGLEQEQRLSHLTSELLDDPTIRKQLQTRLSRFAQPDAARKIAELLIKTETA